MGFRFSRSLASKIGCVVGCRWRLEGGRPWWCGACRGMAKSPGGVFHHVTDAGTWPGSSRLAAAGGADGVSQMGRSLEVDPSLLPRYLGNLHARQTRSWAHNKNSVLASMLDI